MNQEIMLKCSGHVKVNGGSVTLQDIAEVYCMDKGLANKAKTLTIEKLKKPGQRKVISVLYIIDKLQKEFPNTTIQNIGEIDVIIEWEKPMKGEVFKIAVVSLIAFFGTAFTIMAFHNDIEIRSVFQDVYYVTAGTTSNGVGILEISYCLGLFLGITVFFNHIGKKKLTQDPTPVAVAMHNYEKDVNQAIVENAERRSVEEQA